MSGCLASNIVNNEFAGKFHGLITALKFSSGKHKERFQAVVSVSNLPDTSHKLYKNECLQVLKQCSLIRFYP